MEEQQLGVPMDAIRNETYNALVTAHRVVKKIQNLVLREFIQFIFFELSEQYFHAPASRRNHHAYIGGLGYHSATAAELGASIADHYNSLDIEVDKDLVIAGILLHDIGKIYCYELKENKNVPLVAGLNMTADSKSLDDVKPLYNYEHTKNGKLLHHIPMGYELVGEMAKDFNSDAGRSEEDKLPEELKAKLQHIILSHHGRKSWSSPVIPQFVEAYIVHAVEMMDSYVDKYNSGAEVRNIYD